MKGLFAGHVGSIFVPKTKKIPTKRSNLQTLSARDSILKPTNNEDGRIRRRFY
jgi:hypothetical protein